MTNQEYKEHIIPYIAKTWDLDNPSVEHEEIIEFINKVDFAISANNVFTMNDLIETYHKVNLN